jgi:ribosomal protein L22
MADEKDIEEKKDDAPKEAAKKPAAKKAPKKAAVKKEPKADKKPAKADKDEKPAKEKKPRRARAKKAAKDEKPARRKPRAPEELPVVRASAKYVRIAPRKARLVADQVRGLHIEQARALLAFSPRDAARDIQKLIDSAAANAENNHDLVGDEMRITSITVDEGPTLRRFRPRALGRATPINKRTSHIAVALTPVEDD